MISYIDDHRGRFWGRAHLRTLQVAPSTYYAAKKRPPSAHQVGDETLKPEIKRSSKRTSGCMALGRSGSSYTGRVSRWLAAPWNVSWPTWGWKADGEAGNAEPLFLLMS